MTVTKTETKKMRVVFTTRTQQVIDTSISSNTPTDSVSAFSIEASGEGSFSGLNYTVSGHSIGQVTSEMSMLCMTSNDVKNLNDTAMGMLNASAREEIQEYNKEPTSSNLSIWSWLFGGNAASASYKKTHDTMKSKGLTDKQINDLMANFLKIATTMSTNKLNVIVDNRKNDYSVSGNLFFHTMSGVVKTGDGTHQYRMLADKGSAGELPEAGGVPASVNIIPLK